MATLPARRWAITAVTVLLLAVAACSSDGSSDSDSAGPGAARTPSHGDKANPCRLVTPDDLAQVLTGQYTSVGSTRAPLISNGVFEERHCNYEGVGTVMVSTNVDDAPGGTVWKAAEKASKSDVGARSSGYRSLTGLGDDAFFAGDSTIVAREGVIVVEINFLGEPDSSANDDALTQLARRALARL